MGDQTDKAFQIPNAGVIVNRTAGLFSGAAAPETVAPDAPLGSLFLRNNGTLSQRTAFTGSGVAADWTLYLVGGDYEESLEVTTHNFQTYRPKVTLNTTVPALATYAIVVSYGWNTSKSFAAFESRLTVDAVPLGQLHLETIGKELLGDFSTTFGAERRINTRRFRRTTLTAGAHVIELEFRTTKADSMVSMWDATIELIRTS